MLNNLLNIGKFILPPCITAFLFLWWYANFNLGLDIPLNGDAGLTMLWITAAFRETFAFFIENVGAPLTFHMGDYPIYSDFFHLFSIKLVSFFSDNPAVAKVFLFVLSFPLATLSMLIALRWVSKTPYLIAGVISIFYAFASRTSEINDAEW